MKHLLLLVACSIATPAFAAELRLPTAASALPARIATDCSECTAAGFTPCGSQDVRWGRGFAATALLGHPKRGYLPTFTMTGDEFRTLARSTDYAPLLITLRDRFAKTRLVVLEQDFKNARILPPPTKITVTFPAPLHTCVHETDHPWSCCVSDCKQECCEKSLGSPMITMEWTDGDEQLTFHYTHTIGISWLSRTNASRPSTRYACLTDAKGKLR
jgi:hypothetical protein